MLIAVLVAVAPRLSVARAVSTCVPAEALVQFAAHGAEVAVPTSVAPSKYSTLATLPSVSVALAVSEITAPWSTELLLAGAVIDTDGGVFDAGTFVTT